MSWRLRLRKRNYFTKRRIRWIVRSREGFENKRCDHDQPFEKSMVRWGALSAKLIRTITRVINRIDTRLRQRLPQRELEQIVQRALAARYPEAYYRLRSDHRPSNGVYLPYNLSVVDVGPARDSLWRCTYDSCIDNLCSSRNIILAVLSQPVYPDDPRRGWLDGVHDPLKVVNPDARTGFSSDDESENSSVDSGINSRAVGQSVGISRLGRLYESSVEEGFDCSGSTSGSNCMVGTHDTSAFDILSAMLLSELSTDYNPPEKSNNSSVTGPGWVSRQLNDDVPRLPALSFIDQPDPPLCCLIASALQAFDSSIWEDSGICLSSNTRVHRRVECATSPAHSVTSNDKVPKFDIDRSYRKRSSFLSRKGSDTQELEPNPLRIRKNNILRHKLRYGPLPPIPERHPETPYNLQDKMLHGDLPPLPSPTPDTEEQLTHQPPEVYISASASATATTSSSPATSLDPSRQNSLCSACRDIRKRRRALNSHPMHDRHSRPLPNSVTPVEWTRLGFDPTDLPSPLRAGARCNHCTNTWSAMASTPSLPSSLISSSDGEVFPNTPSLSSGSSNSSSGFALPDPVLSSEQHYFSDVLSSDLTVCLGAGATARNRRLLNRGDT